MPKKFDDYYDHDNKIQRKPQTWKCGKCSNTVVVLSALDVSHRCPSNKNAVTFYKKIDA